MLRSPFLVGERIWGAFQRASATFHWLSDEEKSLLSPGLKYEAFDELPFLRGEVKPSSWS
jgi:hypothetical protein